MTLTITVADSLEEFLKLPESKPVCEYINGQIIPKPMPKGKHSRLQLKLSNKINEIVESKKIAYAFPELRCSFGTRSIVPDIAVFRWSRILFEENGEVYDDFLCYPDWSIEILSPEQSSNRVIGNILYCLEYGCELGWLIDPNDRSILVFQPHEQPRLWQGSDSLPILNELDLALSADDIFAWLKMG